jgi:hypothetical protein
MEAVGKVEALNEANSDKEGGHVAPPLCVGVPAAVGEGIAEALVHADAVVPDEGEAPALPDTDADAEALLEAPREALAKSERAPDALAIEADGEELPTAEGVSGRDGCALVEGHDAEAERLGEPVLEEEPLTEADRGGEREAEDEGLSSFDAVATLADAEVEPAALSLARALRDAEGDPVSSGEAVANAPVELCVVDLEVWGDEDKEALTEPLRVPPPGAVAEAQPDDEGTPVSEALTEEQREGGAEADGMDTVGALEAVREPIPPVTVPEGEGSAVGMVVTTAEADTVMVRESAEDEEAAAERDAEREAEGEKLTRALLDGDLVGAFEAEPVTHTVKVGELDSTPLGVVLAEGEPLLLISPVSEELGVETAEEQELNVSLRVPATTEGLGEALVVELCEGVAHALGVEVPCGEKVPSACEALGDPVGVGVAVARRAEALTLTERRGVRDGDNDTLGLPDGDGD